MPSSIRSSLRPRVSEVGLGDLPSSLQPHPPAAVPTERPAAGSSPIGSPIESSRVGGRVAWLRRDYGFLPFSTCSVFLKVENSGAPEIAGFSLTCCFTTRASQTPKCEQLTTLASLLLVWSHSKRSHYRERGFGGDPTTYHHYRLVRRYIPLKWII